jgi:hypothetical protein
MASTKSASKNASAKIKKPIKSVASEIPEEGDLDAGPAKIKSIIDPVELEPAIGIEEKPEEDPIIAPPTDDDEASGDETSLDAEDLNPFGDRWEE